MSARLRSRVGSWLLTLCWALVCLVLVVAAVSNLLAFGGTTAHLGETLQAPRWMAALAAAALSGAEGALAVLLACRATRLLGASLTAVLVLLFVPNALAPVTGLPVASHRLSLVGGLAPLPGLLLVGSLLAACAALWLGALGREGRAVLLAPPRLRPWQAWSLGGVTVALLAVLLCHAGHARAVAARFGDTIVKLGNHSWVSAQATTEGPVVALAVRERATLLVLVSARSRRCQALVTALGQRAVTVVPAGAPTTLAPAPGAPRVLLVVAGLTDRTTAAARAWAADLGYRGEVVGNPSGGLRGVFFRGEPTWPVALVLDQDARLRQAFSPEALLAGSLARAVEATAADLPYGHEGGAACWSYGRRPPRVRVTAGSATSTLAQALGDGTVVVHALNPCRRSSVAQLRAVSATLAGRSGVQLLVVASQAVAPARLREWVGGLAGARLVVGSLDRCGWPAGSLALFRGGRLEGLPRDVIQLATLLKVTL